MPFLRVYCPKVNIIARGEFEFAYYDPAVHHFNHYITKTPHIYIYIYIYIYIQSHSRNQNVIQSHLLRSLIDFNSEFSFFLTGYHIKFKEPSLSYYLPIFGARIIKLIPFPRVLLLCEKPRPGFALSSPRPFPTTITITPRATRFSLSLSLSLYIYIYIYIYIYQSLRTSRMWHNVNRFEFRVFLLLAWLKNPVCPTIYPKRRRMIGFKTSHGY